MPITDKFEILDPGTITVPDDRQRRSVEVKDLAESIRLNGLMNPLVLHRGEAGPILVAGERRLRACLDLGLQGIPVRWVEDLSPLELQILELEENIKRKDLVWQDIVSATCRIHDLFLAVEPTWTHYETADRLALTRPTISLYLKVGKNLNDERVRSSDTVREAWNLLLRREQRLAGDALQELLDSGEPERGGEDSAYIPAATEGPEL